MIIDLNLSNDKAIPNMHPITLMHAANIFTDSTVHTVHLFITRVCLFIVHVASQIPVSSFITINKRVKRILKRF